jgi:hypothetical protein
MELPRGTGEKPLKSLLIDHCAALPKGHDVFLTTSCNESLNSFKELRVPVPESSCA